MNLFSQIIKLNTANLSLRSYETTWPPRSVIRSSVISYAFCLAIKSSDTLMKLTLPYGKDLYKAIQAQHLYRRQNKPTIHRGLTSRVPAQLKSAKTTENLF